MPIFFEQEVDKDTRMAVWHIAEAESFFDVPLQRAITHPHKRLQHLAGRYLLRHLFPDFPLSLIQVADTRKPFLEDEAFHFSISHCGDYAAAIVSRTRRVGIDVEAPSGKVERIRHKFLSSEEEARLGNWADGVEPVTASTMIWSVKEAGFKWYGRGGVDFRNDMPLQSVRRKEDGYGFTMQFGKELQQSIHVQCRVMNGLCLAFVEAAGEKERR